MDILVTYDVSTLTPAGRNRLRRVAKICEGHGQRVQFSVFECTVTDVQLEVLRSRLRKVVHPQEDSIRLYRLRGSREDIVECYGKDSYIDFQAPLII